jgi:hypothetical protein
MAISIIIAELNACDTGNLFLYEFILCLDSIAGNIVYSKKPILHHSRISCIDPEKDFNV